jgi:hypothetical protein
MTPPGTVAPTLSDEQLAELLALTADADAVELKLTVPESNHYEAARALGIDPLEAQVRQVYFFDTPDLSLNNHGIVLRGRRVQRKRGDSVVKLRPVVPGALPEKLRQSPDLVVEVDAMPGGFVCSATLKRRVANADVSEVAAGNQPLGQLLSKEQRAFLSEHAPVGLTPDDLTALGPVLVLKLKFEPEDFARRLVAELWLYPDNSRVLELSTKCEPRDAFRVAAETRVFLAAHGIDLTGAQQTKTTKALVFFAERISGRSRGRS